jgi:hypothetical protein
MSQTNLRIIEELRLFITMVSQDRNLVSVFSLAPNGFTRRRKLCFGRLALLIAKLCKKTLSVEIERFFSEMGHARLCTVSAFCQQRKKLDPMLYRIWNRLLCDSFYAFQGESVKRWEGYRLIAVDGSNLSLVNTPALLSHFGGQSNQQSFFVQAKAMYMYDVLNGLTVNAILAPYRTGELTLAYGLADGIEQDMLTIWDRNFCNYRMMALLMWQEQERKFVIRAKESQKPYRSFIASGKGSEVVTLRPSPSAIAGLRNNGFTVSKDTMLKVRLVRVELPQTVEVIVTNLWEDEHPEQEFKALYFKRWGVETNISHQKNILQLESFSGLSPLAVEQDFYATVFMSNLHALLTGDAQKTLDNSEHKGKYRMKINGNKSHAKLRENFIRLFIDNRPADILRILHSYFIRDPLPIRPGRTFPRTVKNKQSKSKHKTFMNYKPAF